MALGRKTGGRRKGAPNKNAREIRDLAQAHGPGALEELVRLSSSAESESVRLAALRELLDRAYGKPAAPAEDETSLATVREQLATKLDRIAAAATGADAPDDADG